MYTDGYYSDEDFRTFCSGQDAANIDDFFTDNGEYLMCTCPKSPPASSSPASATVTAAMLSARADTPSTRQKMPSATCTRSPSESGCGGPAGGVGPCILAM